MQLADRDLNDFIALYHDAFGKEISRDAALEMATRITNLYLLVYRPLPEELETTRLSEGPQRLAALSEREPACGCQHIAQRPSLTSSQDVSYGDSP